MSFLNNIFVLGVEIIFLRFSIPLNYRLRRMGIKKFKKLTKKFIFGIK